MDDRISVLFEALAADLSSAGIVLTAGLFDPHRGVWMAGTPAAMPQGFETDEPVLVLPGRELSITRVNGEPNCAAIVDAVCDWAMDELGHGWPELADDDGNFVAILRAAERPGGVTWAGGGQTVAVGQLATVPLVVPHSAR
jgi:hypothetical protein